MCGTWLWQWEGGDVCLMFVAKFIFLWHLHLFIASRFLLACVFRELVILMHYE